MLLKTKPKGKFDGLCEACLCFSFLMSYNTIHLGIHEIFTIKYLITFHFCHYSVYYIFKMGYINSIFSQYLLT